VFQGNGLDVGTGRSSSRHRASRRRMCSIGKPSARDCRMKRRT
jgi:hypothetical protein